MARVSEGGRRDAAASRETIVRAARRWIGTPYHHQASTRGVGVDCLGLVRGVFRELFGCEPEPLPGYSADWGEAGGGECLLEAAERHLMRAGGTAIEPGDVLIFRIRRAAIAKHAAIASSRGAMIHAIEKAGTIEVPISAWWRRRLVGQFSFPVPHD
ncbi:MAG: NlpC/P60 family protein [Hyphomicrobiaceae bacterium]